MIRNSITKIIAILTIVSLNWIGLSAVIETLAYYNDTENSSANSFSATTLGFYLTAGDWEPIEKAINLQPSESVTRSISVVKDGNLDFQYNASTVIDTENSDTGFCDALNLEAKLGDEVKYPYGSSGDSLAGLSFENPILISSGQDDWTFTVTLSDSYAPPEDGASCVFTFIFEGWQEGTWGQGFNDTEELDNTIETGGSTTSGYSPIADAYIDQSKPNDNYGNSKELSIKSKNPDNNRTFIKFDFNFPSGTTIISSALKLYMKLAPSISRTYEAWRVTGSWTEGGIKWKEQPTVAGTATDSVSSGTTKNVWLPWDVTSDVRSFVSGTSNYGWQLRDSSENSSTAYEAKFYSREEGKQLALRPILEVQFSAPEIITDHLVVNEVYYHIGTGKGKDPDNEWVEIYNPTDSEVNISGWKICDGNSCDTIPTSSPIPSKGFAVITYKSSTWDKWPSIPSEAIKIVLDSAVGKNGLENAGDRVILKNASDSVIDAMSYGNDTTYFELSVSGKGKSLARIIKGYDTNSATDWIINATPNPGTNPSVDGVETLIFTSYGVAVAGYEPVIEEDDSGEEEIFEEEPVVEEESMIEEETTEDATTEEVTEEETLDSEIEEAKIIIIDEAFISAPFINTPTEEQAQEETVEEYQNTETVEEPTVTSETGNPEDTVSEEQSVIEEQPVIGSDNDSSGQVLPIDAATADTGGANNGSDGASTDTVVAADAGSSGESAVVE